MNTALPTLFIIGLSLLAFTFDKTDFQQVAMVSPTPVAIMLDQTYRNNQYGFSFRYPAQWQIKENQDKGTQKLEVKSPTGLTLIMSSTPNKPEGDCEVNDQTVMGTENIKILGNNLTVHFVGNREKDTITYAYLLSSSDPCTAIPYISLPNKTAIKIEILHDKLTEQPAELFKSDDYKTAKDILSSVKLQ